MIKISLNNICKAACDQLSDSAEKGPIRDLENYSGCLDQKAHLKNLGRFILDASNVIVNVYVYNNYIKYYTFESISKISCF